MIIEGRWRRVVSSKSYYELFIDVVVDGVVERAM